SNATRTIDLRQRTGDAGVQPLGWAFDPKKPATLRVVDTKNRVWSLDVAGGKAQQTGTLPKGAWVFNNGFNRNTGQPYVESITSSETNPPGNGMADTSETQRAGGTVLGSGSKGLAALPTSPCRLASAFKTTNGTTWTFCADSASIRTYVLAPGGQHWASFGKPSTAVAPEAAGFGFAVPSQG
ncbi:MAG: hypothetical protein JOZ82_00495, partial [Marmoricola sp.]|nr:hypothetical protein [Marmoricola sp.]